jgi:hypothetical protein
MVESSEATGTHVFGNNHSHRSCHPNSYANADANPYQIGSDTVKSKESLYYHQHVVSFVCLFSFDALLVLASFLSLLLLLLYCMFERSLVQ